MIILKYIFAASFTLYSCLCTQMAMPLATNLFVYCDEDINS